VTRRWSLVVAGHDTSLSDNMKIHRGDAFPPTLTWCTAAMAGSSWTARPSRCSFSTVHDPISPGGRSGATAPSLGPKSLISRVREHAHYPL
jgi:hypothetical protein